MTISWIPAVKSAPPRAVPERDKLVQENEALKLALREKTMQTQITPEPEAKRDDLGQEKELNDFRSSSRLQTSYNSVAGNAVLVAVTRDLKGRDGVLSRSPQLASGASRPATTGGDRLQDPLHIIRLSPTQPNTFVLKADAIAHQHFSTRGGVSLPVRNFQARLPISPLASPPANNSHQQFSTHGEVGMRPAVDTQSQIFLQTSLPACSMQAHLPRSPPASKTADMRPAVDTGSQTLPLQTSLPAHNVQARYPVSPSASPPAKTAPPPPIPEDDSSVALIASMPVTLGSVQPGSQVMVHALQGMPRYNGQIGSVECILDGGRIGVLRDVVTSAIVSLKPENPTLVTAASLHTLNTPHTPAAASEDAHISWADVTEGVWGLGIADLRDDWGACGIKFWGSPSKEVRVTGFIAGLACYIHIYIYLYIFI